MNNIIKSIVTLSAISLLLAGCEAFDKKDESQKQKPTTKVHLLGRYIRLIVIFTGGVRYLEHGFQDLTPEFA